MQGFLVRLWIQRTLGLVSSFKYSKLFTFALCCLRALEICSNCYVVSMFERIMKGARVTCNGVCRAFMEDELPRGACSSRQLSSAAWSTEALFWGSDHLQWEVPRQTTWQRWRLYWKGDMAEHWCQRLLKFELLQPLGRGVCVSKMLRQSLLWLFSKLVIPYGLVVWACL